MPLIKSNVQKAIKKKVSYYITICKVIAYFTLVLLMYFVALNNFTMRLLLILILSLITTLTYSQENKDLAMCCATKKEVGRCTGSASCTACSNCSRCKYCSQQGGSCGVCGGGSSSYSNTSTYNYRYTPTKKKTTKSTNSYYTTSSNRSYLANDVRSKYYYKTLVTNAEKLNLREGPGIYYDIIYELGNRQEMIFLAMTGDWVKVRVKSNNMIGFVHKDYVLVVD